jgi:hypothetical protein
VTERAVVILVFGLKMLASSQKLLRSYQFLFGQENGGLSYFA